MHTNTTLQDLSLKIHEYNTFFFFAVVAGVVVVSGHFFKREKLS